MGAEFWPGATPEQQFTVPYPAADIAAAVVTYRQDTNNIFEREVTEFTDAGEDKAQFGYTLTQEETLLLDDKRKTYIQINLLMADGTRNVSVPFPVPTFEQYHREVMEGGGTA